MRVGRSSRNCARRSDPVAEPLFSSPFTGPVAFAWLDERALADHPLLPEEEAFLSPRAIDKYRREVTLGRGAARVAMAALGLPPRPIGRGELRQPLWPTEVVGAITHAVGYAAAAVAPASETVGVGIDLEWLDPKTNFRQIGARICHGPEREWLSSFASDDDHDRAVLQLFSAKESVFKAFFPQIGVHFGFDAATLVWDAEVSEFTGRLEAPYDQVVGADGFRVRCAWKGDLVLTGTVLPAPGR